MKRTAYTLTLIIAAISLATTTRAMVPPGMRTNTTPVPDYARLDLSAGLDGEPATEQDERLIELAMNNASPDDQSELAKEELQRAKEEVEQAQEDAKNAQEEVKRAQEEAKRMAEEAKAEAQDASASVAHGGSGGSGGGGSYSYSTGGPFAPVPPMAPTASVPPARRHQGMNIYGYGYGSSGHGDRALVIRSTPTDAKTMAATEEDLNIMGRILEKALNKTGDDDEDQAMGIRLVTVSMSSGHMKRLQIEGYGAMFMLNVDFPLVGPAVKTKDSETNEPTNSTWDEAKHEVYGRPASADEDNTPDAFAKDKFDAKRVEKLKDSLLSALKNASNMRNLKSDETVTLVVTSGSGDMFNMEGLQRGLMTLKRGLTSWSSATAGPVAVNQSVMPEYSGNGVLTISVRKSEIDAFAKGKLSLEEFRNKAKVLIY